MKFVTKHDYKPSKDYSFVLTDTQEIKGVGNVFRYRIGKQNYHRYRDILSVDTSDGKRKYYKFENGKKVELFPKMTRVSDVIEYEGNTLPLEFEYTIIDGEFYIFYFPILIDDIGRTYECVRGYYGDDLVWIGLGKHTGDYQSDYRLLYNLKTGEVMDVLEGLIPEDMPIETIQISPKRTKLIVKEFGGGLPGRYYYIDPKENKAILVNEACSLKNFYGCSFASEDILSVRQYVNESLVDVTDSELILNGYIYSVETGEMTESYNSEDGNRSIFMGMGGSGYIIEKSDNKFWLITPPGKRYEIEGLNGNQNYDFLMNPGFTKILVINSTSRGFKITELGVIDIQTLELKLFERKNSSQNEETSIGWINNNSFEITASNNNDYMYIYTVK